MMEAPRHRMTDEQIRQVQERYGVGPHLAADLVVFSVRFHDARPEPVALLIERKHPPYPATLACPGGFVELHEDLEDGARRELAEETGLTDLGRAWLQQLGAWGRPGRDPRSRVISIVYLALVPWSDLARPKAGDDASQAAFFRLQAGVPVDDSGAPKELAFDHEDILAHAWKRIGELARATSAPLRLLPGSFSGPQLAGLWSLLTGDDIDEARLLSAMARWGWIEPAQQSGLWRARSLEVASAPAWWAT